jgi:hypothetical protein
MRNWLIAHLFSILVWVPIAAGIVALWHRHQDRALDKPAVPLSPATVDEAAATPIKLSHHATTDSAWGCAFVGLAIYWLVGLAFSALFLIFLYGIVVLVFRHAFGIELPFGRFN